MFGVLLRYAGLINIIIGAYLLGEHDPFILFRDCKKSRRFINVILT